MNDNQLELHLARWLADGPAIAPASLAGAASAYALAHPRPRRFNSWRSLVAGAGFLARPTPVALRPLMLVALLTVAFGLGAFFYAAWHNTAVVPQPSPTMQPSPGPAGYTCPLGSSPDQPGPAGQTRLWTGVAGSPVPVTFDSARGRVIAFDLSGSLWEFDVCTNTWASSGIWLASGEWPNILVYDPKTDRLLVDEGITNADAPGAHTDVRLAAYDLANGGRTVNAPLPFDVSSVHAVFRPRADQLVVRDDAGSRLWAYDVLWNRWHELGQAGDVPPASGSAALLAYDPTVDRLVLYSRNDWNPGSWEPRTYEYDFGTSTWTREADPLPVDLVGGIGRHEIAYDEALGRVVIFSHSGGISYDAARHGWEALRLNEWLSGDASSYGDRLAYDSTNERVVVFDQVGSGGVIAIDAVNGTWRTLLEPIAPTSPVATPSPTVTPPASPIVSPSPSQSPTSSPSVAAFECPRGTRPNTPGPSDQTRPWTGGDSLSAGPMTFDSARGLVFALNGSPLSLWQFDVCTNTWSKSSIALRSAQAPQILVYDPNWDHLLVDEGATKVGVDAAHSDTRLVSYFADGQGWEQSGPVPFDVSSVHAVFRPAADQLVVRDDAASRLYAYDPMWRAWQELGQAGDVPPAGGSAALLAYDPSVDRLVLYSRNSSNPGHWEPRTYEYDFATSTWTREADPPAVDLVYGIGRHEIAYDEALGRVVIFSHSGGISYDAAGHGWGILNLDPGLTSSYWSALVYDSVNKRLMVFDGGGLGFRRGVIAIDPVTQSWQTLLEPSAQ